MAQRTSDRFARGTSHRSGNGRNEPTGGDDSGVARDNQHSDQRPPCLAGGKHTHRAFTGCATRANSAAAPAVRNAHPMVVGVVFILVEPTGYNTPARSRAARKDRNNCCARTGEPFRRRFSRTIHRLQAWYRMIREAIAARLLSTPCHRSSTAVSGTAAQSTIPGQP
jgi:hypothetical protein